MDHNVPAPARLVLDNWAWAQKLARHRSRVTFGLDPEEAIGEAALGLVDAARRYDPGIGVPFRVFARRRIEGAILDYHRQQDTAGRHQRARMNAGKSTRYLDRGWRPPERSARDTSEMAESLAAPPGPTAEDMALMAEIYRMVRDLPAPFCNVLERQYFRGETQKTIGASMGVSESRVCQIARAGIAMLALAAKESPP